MPQKGCNTYLRCSSIAARIRYPRRSRDLRSVDELRETVGPLVVEAVVGAEINDDAFAAADFVNGIHERFADAVGESHDPAVNLTSFFHPADVVWTEVFVRDLALVVAFKFLTGEFAGGDVAKVHMGVVVEDVNECLAEPVSQWYSMLGQKILTLPVYPRAPITATLAGLEFEAFLEPNGGLGFVVVAYVREPVGIVCPFG